jgi:hypothetical protein
MNITLTPDIEKALKEYACKQGTTPEALAIHALQERFVSSSETKSIAAEQETLFGYLADYIGVLSSTEHIAGGARMSENCGKRFAKGLIKKRQDGRL